METILSLIDKRRCEIFSIGLKPKNLYLGKKEKEKLKYYMESTAIYQQNCTKCFDEIMGMKIFYVNEDSHFDVSVFSDKF